MDAGLIDDYLKSIRLAGAMADRVHTIHDLYTEKLGISVEDIFINSSLSKDGTYEYGSLWLLNKQELMEAKSFLVTDDFDYTTLRNCVRYWRIRNTNYNFNSASERSQLLVEMIMTTGTTGTFRAIGKNCEKLVDVLRNYIVPNSISTA